MTLGRTTDNKIKIKTDGDAGPRAVSCGCCGPCGGCADLIGSLDGDATSLAWTATLSIAPNIGCPNSHAILSGVIERVEGEAPPCSANVGYAKRCYIDCYDYEEWMGESYQCYGSTVAVNILVGKFKTETFENSDDCFGTYTATTLVNDPEADCAYWLRLTPQESFGASGWSISLPGFTGPIQPENLIGSHSVTGSVYAGTISYEGDDDVATCSAPVFFERSASITFS